VDSEKKSVRSTAAEWMMVPEMPEVVDALATPNTTT